MNSIKKAGHQGAILPKGGLCPGMAQEKGPQAGHARGPEIYSWRAAYKYTQEDGRATISQAWESGKRLQAGALKLLPLPAKLEVQA